jgi:hypothetical protein
MCTRCDPPNFDQRQISPWLVQWQVLSPSSIRIHAEYDRDIAVSRIIKPASIVKMSRAVVSLRWTEMDVGPNPDYKIIENLGVWRSSVPNLPISHVALVPLVSCRRQRVQEGDEDSRGRPRR